MYIVHCTWPTFIWRSAMPLLYEQPLNSKRVCGKVYFYMNKLLTVSMPMEKSQAKNILKQESLSLSLCVCVCPHPLSKRGADFF